MKPVDFTYRQARTLDEALGALASNADAKIMAGGQTLGPMLNLRLAQPAEIIDITRISELGRVHEEGDAVTFGAVITHASFEDGRTPDPTGGFMQRVASGIGYRAVRVRGTIGGSLAHADPAADWMSCLLVLGAQVLINGLRGARRVPLDGFMRGALDTVLEPGEIISGIRLAKPSPTARYGYHKFCRKEGEFADAIGAAMQDPGRGVFRLVASTPAGPPIVIERVNPIPVGEIAALLEQAGAAGDGYERRLSQAVVKRALHEAAL